MARSDTSVRLAVTGLGWLGAGAGSITTALEALIRSARSELTMLAYAWSDGAEQILPLLQERLRHGVRVTLIVNRFDQQFGKVPARLRTLADTYPGQCVVYDFQGSDPTDQLHAKVVVVDRERALLGSANLSWYGLVTNHEVAVLLDGPAASELARLTDRLINQALVRGVEGLPGAPTAPHTADRTSDHRTVR